MSRSRWELAEYDHPVIAPLLEYKKLMRLMSANGWAWLDEWARGAAALALEQWTVVAGDR